MAKQTRTAKKRKVVSGKGDDWLLRFLRQHSLGVMLLALLSAGGGWLVWHSRDCMTDQRTQVTATRKAWIKKRVALQKLLDDDDTLLTRVELLERHQGIGVEYEQWDQDRKALIEILQTLSNDCNDIKVADYELEAEEKDLGRVFPFYSPSKPMDDPEACGEFLRLAEKLRSPESPKAGNSETPKFDLHISTSEFRETISRGRETDVKAAESYESFLARLENMSFASRIKQCF
jgi:hypothetical protein